MLDSTVNIIPSCIEKKQIGERSDREKDECLATEICCALLRPLENADAPPFY